jgi:quercetin 2,3-dioxygenase
MMKAIARFIHVKDLFISQPNPAWFGNPPNSADRNWSNENWLKSRFHFNFAEYHEGRNSFGVLRVVNDDLVQPARGFGRHGHGKDYVCISLYYLSLLLMFLV